VGPLRPGGFDHELRLHQQEREHRILDRATPIPSYPEGFRAEDFAGGNQTEGFLLVEDAARAMSMSKQEVMDAAAHGLLEWQEWRGRILIRPAIVTVLRTAEGQA
jgi:hypothetical protein